MPFEKGHKKLGGRKKGTPNKTTADYAQWVDTAVALAGMAVAPSLKRTLMKMGVPEAEIEGIPAPAAYLTKVALEAPNTFVGKVVAKRLPQSLDVGLGEGERSIEIKIVTGVSPSLGEPGDDMDDSDDDGPPLDDD